MLWGHAVSCFDGSDLNGIHLVWASQYGGRYSVRGFDIWRRQSQFSPEIYCFDLTPPELDRLHAQLRLEKEIAIVSLRLGSRPQSYANVPDEPFSPLSPNHGQQAAFYSSLPATSTSDFVPREKLEHIDVVLDQGTEKSLSLLVQPDKIIGLSHLLPHVKPQDCLIYEIEFDQLRQMVSINIGVSAGLAIGMRDSKAVESRSLTPMGPFARVSFEKRKIERVLVYVFEKASSLRVCYGEINPEQERIGWQEADLVAKGIQLPLREVNSDLSTYGDELSLAQSRLLGIDYFRDNGFQELSELMNPVAKTADRNSPLHFSLMLREQPGKPFFEISPWQYGMGLMMSATGRRVLGFSFLDAGQNLNQGDLYDYRIVGYFKRRDVEEKFFGFHTVPTDARLPLVFYLDCFRFMTLTPTKVECYPPIPSGSLRHLCRKGIRIEQILTIHFPEPLSRIILEHEPVDYHNLQYQAQLETLSPFFPSVGYFGSVPVQRRVELEFASPVDRLDLVGTGFLYGLRISNIAPGEDPEEIVEHDVTIYGVCYGPTPTPDPPPVLGTTNLQKPQKMGKPQDTVKQPIKNLGFHLTWLPPGSPYIWPPDLPVAPPMDVVSFEIERRRVDTNEKFKPMDEDETFGAPTTVVGSRSSSSDPDPLNYGADLLQLFPEQKNPQPPVPVWMELEDVLFSPGKPKGPPPGSLQQYRIYSVDIIGRRSAQATVGSVVKLEKHLLPPQPPGPIRQIRQLDPNVVRPHGVSARVIQSSDPYLTEADKEILDGDSDAIVLEWGWTEEERKRDPFAKEFRIYFHSNPPDIVKGTVSKQPVWKGSAYEMTVTMNQNLKANHFAGQYINAGGYPFRISAHDGGSANVKVYLEPSQLKPTALPAPTSIVLTPFLDGEERRPGNWEERRKVKPITAKKNYKHVFKNVFTGSLLVSPANPEARVWVGVSAADDQVYVSDEFPARKPNGGRPGNESSIVVVPVVARYFGRPTLQGPRPLWQVPETVLDEVESKSVPHTLDLPALLPKVKCPSGHQVLVERISGADIMSMLSKTVLGMICLTLPDGKKVHFKYGEDPTQPGDKNDQIELLAAIASGEAARIANRFLLDMLWRLQDEDLSTIWTRVPSTPVPFGNVTDAVPNKAERYFYRLRLVDQAGHVSQGAALIPKAYRVPSRRTPGQPQMDKPERDQDAVTVKLDVLDAFDLDGVLVFFHAEDASCDMGPALVKRPHLLRVPNRPDLYPQDGIRLRLADGSSAKQMFLDRSQGVLDPQNLTVAFKEKIAVGFDKRVVFWAAAVTRDGIPSLLVSPRIIATVPAPPLVPTLKVVSNKHKDEATWGVSEAGTRLTLEMSTDGGTTWRRVSPWLRANVINVTEHQVIAPPTGIRLYRLRVRKVGREEDEIGTAVQLGGGS